MIKKWNCLQKKGSAAPNKKKWQEKQRENGKSSATWRWFSPNFCVDEYITSTSTVSARTLICYHFRRWQRKQINQRTSHRTQGQRAKKKHTHTANQLSVELPSTELIIIIIWNERMLRPVCCTQMFRFSRNSLANREKSPRITQFFFSINDNGRMKREENKKNWKKENITVDHRCQRFINKCAFMLSILIDWRWIIKFKPFSHGLMETKQWQMFL